jgi:hypothetical protein
MDRRKHPVKATSRIDALEDIRMIRGEFLTIVGDWRSLSVKELSAKSRRGAPVAEGSRAQVLQGRQFSPRDGYASGAAPQSGHLIDHWLKARPSLRSSQAFPLSPTSAARRGGRRLDFGMVGIEFKAQADVASRKKRPKRRATMLENRTIMIPLIVRSAS